MNDSDDQSRTADFGSICDRSLDWAAERQFAGYDPYDGLNSPLIDTIARNWFTRLLGIHAVDKAPVNVRPLLGVPKERNPKGIALFAMAYLNRHRETGRESDRAQAKELLGWLDANQSPDFDEAAWGYNFDWQNGRQFFLPAYSPSIVVTVFVGKAFLEYYEAIGDEWALDVARSAVSFIQSHINRERVNGFDVFSYTPDDSFVLVNTNALAAGLFYAVAPHTEGTRLSERATELYEFVCDVQAESGGWYYSVPSEESHLSHDNFHTGFVLESLYQYAMDKPADHHVRRSYRDGMRFYRSNLFDDDGAPRFESDQRYPYDAHAAAQAILTFAQTGTEPDRAMGRKVCRWTLSNMMDESAYFYRRVGRVLTDHTPYMRWSQAWMCRALSKLSLVSSEIDRSTSEYSPAS
jgi:hypothetical protein